MSNRQIDAVTHAMYILLRDSPRTFAAQYGIQLLTEIWAGNRPLRRPRVAWFRLDSGDIRLDGISES